MREADVLRWLPTFGPMATKAGISPALVAAVIHQESGGNPEALSPAGAKGLMQLMDGTAAALGVTDSFDPAQNLAGGIQHLALQHARFGAYLLTLAAYNAGPQAVEDAGHQVPPFAETQRYVQSVASLALDYLDLDVDEIVATGRFAEQAPFTGTWREAAGNTLGVADLLSDALRSVKASLSTIDDHLTQIEHAMDELEAELPPVAPKPGG